MRKWRCRRLFTFSKYGWTHNREVLMMEVLGTKMLTFPLAVTCSQVLVDTRLTNALWNFTGGSWRRQSCRVTMLVVWKGGRYLLHLFAWGQQLINVFVSGKLVIRYMHTELPHWMQQEFSLVWTLFALDTICLHAVLQWCFLIMSLLYLLLSQAGYAFFQ